MMLNDTFIYLALTVLIASFIQGSVGIGFALIAAPVMGVIQPSLLPVTVLILMIPLNILVSYNEKEHIEWSSVTWVTLGRFFGTFFGLWLIIVLATNQLKIAVGVFTVVAATIALFMPKFTPNKKLSINVGMITGITETATGIGGPPLAIYYQFATASVLRSSVAVCFLLGELLSLMFLAYANKITADHLEMTIALLPFLLIGCFVARFTHNMINPKFLRLLVLIFSLVSGIYLIISV